MDVIECSWLMILCIWFLMCVCIVMLVLVF